MKRRDFIRKSAVSATLLGVSPVLFNSFSAADPLHDFGIISGLVGKMLKQDPKGTLIKLSEMGYKYLEFGGTFGMETSELKPLLKDLGITPLAGGTNMASLQGDGLKQAIDDQLEMDKKYLICYWPWMDGGDNITMDYLKFAVEQFNLIGEKCNENGLRFAFHNHDKEFKKIEGKVIYDFFMESTAPEIMTMQLDLYWIIVGGGDPIEYIKRYPGRYDLLHVKDSYDITSTESFACVGSGVIDFEPIFRLRETGGFKHLIVERDRGEATEEDCARSSIEHLKTLKF